MRCTWLQVLTLWCGGEAYEFSKPIIRTWARTGTLQSAAGTVVSPLPGKVIKVGVAFCVQISFNGEMRLKSVCITSGLLLANCNH